jgi:RND family efflux transporter MFP subunit
MRKYAAVGSAMLLLALAVALPLYSADVASTAAPQGFKAITKPKNEATISFVHPGRILKVYAGFDDKVTEGQLLAQQDDEEEQAAKEQDRLAAESEIEIEAERVLKEQKEIDVKKFKQYGSQFEYENAVVELKIEEKKIEVAQLHHEQAKAKYKQSSVLVEKFKVLAPFSGQVTEEGLKAGENAEGGNMKLMRIVQIDTLRVDVPAPRAVAEKLKKGDPATVTFTVDEKVKEVTGKVTGISANGDAASNTIPVRVEVPNPKKSDGENVSAGGVVFVNFPSPSGGVARP